MTPLQSQNDVAIYVDTLFMLARDAWRHGRSETFQFITERYLTGLVPAAALQAFITDLEPIALAAGSTGGTKSPPPAPPPAPPSPPPAPRQSPPAVRLRESETLAW